MDNKELAKIVGNSFEEMSIQQMTEIQGTGIEQVESSPVYAISRAGIAASRASSARCAKWVSAAVGISYARHHG